MKGLPNAFYVTPGLASITVTRKDLQELLLATDGWAIIRGRMMEIKSKHLGAGVYRVTVEDKREALRSEEVGDLTGRAASDQERTEFMCSYGDDNRNRRSIGKHHRGRK